MLRQCVDAFVVDVLVFDLVDHFLYEMDAETSGPSFLEFLVQIKLRSLRRVERLRLLVDDPENGTRSVPGHGERDVRRALGVIFDEIGKEFFGGEPQGKSISFAQSFFVDEFAEEFEDRRKRLNGAFKGPGHGSDCRAHTPAIIIPPAFASIPIDLECSHLAC